MVSKPRLTLRVDASQDGLRAAASALDRFESEHGLDTASAWPVHVALDEVLSNIVWHGSRGRADTVIDVAIAFEAGQLEVEVSDDGPELNPLTLPEPDTTVALEARQPGGLGVHLVRSLMDRVAYSREDGRNRLVFARECGATGRPERSEE